LFISRFHLEPAQDADVGSNTLRTYALNKNEYFVLHVKNDKDGTKVPEIVLQKALDREKQSIHHLILTGIDGGDPVRSGNAQITIKVLDANDNAPVFEQDLYEIKVVENSAPGTIIQMVKAIDLDDGVNSEIEYSLGSLTQEAIKQLFSIDSDTGELTISKRNIDNESTKSYRFDFSAKDKGNPELMGHSSVHINIIDENDNSPEIILTSSPSPVPENASVRTVVALINVKDLDFDANGKVNVNISPGIMENRSSPPQSQWIY
uniref:Cadherin domain-containing protein n=1 Tax=Sinocyclocheilus rhinocerous TaxID=307959 RepID=A0A673FE88_9TELE